MKKGSEDKIGILDVRRAELLRTLGMKITPAMREYYRYTGISAEVEKQGLGHSDDSRFQRQTPSEAAEHRGHGR